MEIEFECGTVVSDVGEPTMALQHHLTQCQDTTCRSDIKDHIERMS